MAEPVRTEAGLGLLDALLEDGRPLLGLAALGLALSGVFALFLAVTGWFLPQDVAFLGMQPTALCGLHGCRVVHFMFHDRVAFGGTLLAISVLYLWLVAFPLRQGEEWAWWVFALTGACGFFSFLAFLLYGYLDSWHAVATAGLLPLYAGGLLRTRRLLPARLQGTRSLLSPGSPWALDTRMGRGRAAMLFVGLGMTLAGAVITVLGSTVVFVPQDLEFMGYTAAQLREINAHLVPLIAHDRAGFGSGLACCGLTVLMVMWKAPLTRALWQALLISGLFGFGCALGVHYPMGYRSLSHLTPAWIGAAVYAMAMILLWPAADRKPGSDNAVALHEG